jgi:thiamine pyrophosphokinase
VQDTSVPGADAPLVVFEGPVAIVGGGAVDPALLRELAARGVALVGADGGADAIGDAGLLPAAIIGDLDSLRDRAAWEKRTRVIHMPDQITTDFQKAIRATSAPVTLALGMTGKRLDHTLAALSAVLQYAPSRRLLLVDEVDVALAVVGSIRFPAGPRERVSIHPMLPIRFSHSTGLFYPMDGLLLEPGGLIGTSNEGVGGSVEVVPDDATPWLLILGKERLWDLMEASQSAA